MEQIEGTSQGQGTVLSQPNSAPAYESTQVQTAPAEKTFSQSVVNDIVQRAKFDAVETYRRKQLEQPQYVEQKYGESRPLNPPVPQQPFGESPEDRYRRLAREEVKSEFESIQKALDERRQNEIAEKTVRNFYDKVKDAREKYPDLEKALQSIDLTKYLKVVEIIGNEIDNADDVLNELVNDDERLIRLEDAANRDYGAAVRIAKKFSNSVKEKSNARNLRLPNEPLSQMRPSNNTGTDNGALSVAQLRAKYKV